MTDKRKASKGFANPNTFPHKAGKAPNQVVQEESHEPPTRMEPSHVANEQMHHESKGRTKGSGGGVPEKK